MTIVQKNIKPFYYSRLKLVKQLLEKNFTNDIPYYLYEIEGGMFQWVWFKDLPVSDVELYNILKLKGVFITPGSIFFQGIDDEWSHKNECIRLSITADEDDLNAGIKILSEVIQDIYQRNT